MVCSSLELVGSRKLVIDQLRTFVLDDWQHSKKTRKSSKENTETDFKNKKAHAEKRMSKMIPRNIKSVEKVRLCFSSHFGFIGILLALYAVMRMVHRHI